MLCQGVVHDERCKRQTAGYSTLSQLQGVKAPPAATTTSTAAAAAAAAAAATDSSITDSSVIDLQQQLSNVNGGYDDTAPGAFSDFADESIDLADWINPAYLKVCYSTSTTLLKYALQVLMILCSIPPCTT
jgi:hypothetical protein